MNSSDIGDRWDWEYTIRNITGRAPLPIVSKVIEIAQPGQRLLYVGIGDGRNFLPLIDAGLDAVGCELSKVSIDRILAERPDIASRVFLGHAEEVFEGDAPFDGIVASRVLVHSDLRETVTQLATVCRLLRPGGFFAAQWTASGTDPWPGWTHASLDEKANLHLTYADAEIRKVYLSFAGCAELIEGAGLEIESGPVAVELPRTAAPGGIVRDWISIARRSSPAT